MKLLLKNQIFVLLLCPFLSIGQSLTFEDLIGLQSNSFEKAKGFFNYKGWIWSGTTKDCSNCLNEGNYDLVYDKTVWTNGSESIQLLQKAGYKNAVIYYISQSAFNALEIEAKNNLSSSGTGTDENRIWSLYKGQGLKFTFNQKKTKEYYSEKTSYNIIITNENDINSRVAQICSNCKGKGQIIESEKCRYCSGSGVQKCGKCSGTGKFYEQSVIGQPDQSGIYKVEASGASPIWYRYINRQWQWTPYNPPSDIWMPVTTTIVNGGNYNGGEPVKANIDIIKYLEKNNPNYEEDKIQCTKCNGTGNTGLLCASCNGKGITKREIKKVCTACNGSKLKQE